MCGAGAGHWQGRWLGDRDGGLRAKADTQEVRALGSVGRGSRAKARVLNVGDQTAEEPRGRRGSDSGGLQAGACGRVALAAEPRVTDRVRVEAEGRSQEDE